MIPDLYERKLGFWEMFRGSWVIFSSQIKYLFILVLGISVAFKAFDFLFFEIIPLSVNDQWLARRLSSPFYLLFGFIPTMITILIVQKCLSSDGVTYRGLWKGLLKIFWVGFLSQFFYQMVGSLTWVPHLISRYTTWHASTTAFLQMFVSVVGMALLQYFLFYQHAIVFRGQRVFSSFAYSFRVVRGRWWRVFGVMALCSLLTIFPVYILSTIFFKMIPGVPFQEKMKMVAPVISFAGSFFNIFISVYFLNLDRDNPESKQCPVDPVIPSKNESNETVS
jgi:hypothetical protein